MSGLIARVILAHGAGAGSDSVFMQEMATLLQKRHIEVVLFDFDYMLKMNETGRRRPPEKIEKLQEQFLRQLDIQDTQLPLFIAGKSMGGRVASLIYADAEVKGCMCLGYPFHPPGKPDKLRTEHLKTLSKPLLVLQGERDNFGYQTEIDQYALPDIIRIQYLKDGDHSFKPRKSSGISWEENLGLAADGMVEFIQDCIGVVKSSLDEQ